jgi:AcrR family transcriptional regulator
MKSEDPRVTRTRRLIVDAFRDLHAQKSFHEMSVQEIAARATVNRATFYAHFEDKYALLDHVVREWIQDALASQGLIGARFTPENLQLLIETVLDAMARFLPACRPAERDVQPTVESRMQRELADYLRGWLADLPVRDGAPCPALETLASALGWTLFGAGMDWARHTTDETMPERARQIFTLLTEGLSEVLDLASLQPATDSARPKQLSRPALGIPVPR